MQQFVGGSGISVSSAFSALTDSAKARLLPPSTLSGPLLPKQRETVRIFPRLWTEGTLTDVAVGQVEWTEGTLTDVAVGQVEWTE